ncbi:hypothetical protein [Candidatus Venteria ishoeyi]|uniref:Uncharacterized protein n=1 Tax=Candidatus Venteria ishoeyi TaxID=1899563 RepID=A0A1H6F7A9_9GAMM|nr:hypothetical protein [Candidatus Venteria ishoeyi]SEH05271.1 Uncharacterised protein [Candidatus Venteria ishoeyi]
MYKVKRNNSVKGFGIVKIPQIYNNVIFYENRIDLHKEDGFYEIMKPTKTNSQRYAPLTVDCLNDDTMEATYPIVDLTQEEIEADLALLKQDQILSFEQDTDELIKFMVGERSNEYLIAEKESREFKSFGYPEDDVPFSVSSDALANGYSNQEACDVIIQMSDNWRAAQMMIRSQRLSAKSKTKKAENVEELEEIKGEWEMFLNNLKGQLLQ